MKHAKRWTMLVFALALGAQIQAHAKSAEPRLEKELSLNDVYTSPYETTTTTMAAPKPTYFMSGSLMKFEPVFGLTMSTYTGATGNYSFSQKTGYLAGVGILVGRGNLQFETGVLYAERGGKETFLMGPKSWDIEYKNHFIEVPLMARYNIESSKETRIYVKAGAVVGVLQDSTGNVSNAQNIDASYPAAYGYNGYYPYNSYNGAYYTPGGTAVNDGNTKNYFGSTEMRWAAGIGGVVRITRNIAWTMDADYQNSISKVSDTQPNGYYGTTPFTLKAVTYGLNTGLLFSL